MYRRSVTAAIIFAGLCLAAIPLAAAGKEDPQIENKPDAKAAQAREKVSAPSQHSGGMVVVRDPATGQLRAPTAEEAAALRAAAPAARRITPAPREFASPTGGVGMMLDESTAVYAVATRGADGKVSVSEVTGGDAATKSTKQTPAKKTVKGADQNEG